jgi:hypothetical protein
MVRELIDPEKMHGAPFEVPEEHGRLYRIALEALNASGVPYVVSGAFAMYAYTGLWRNTKDLDVFVERPNVQKVLSVLGLAGFEVELTDDSWLGKAKRGEVLVDVIFAAGNMVAAVDSTWMERARPATVLGVETRLASPEELISFKAFICERHRFDGADIAHMIQGLKGALDWDHLLDRMDEHWELLLWHLIFFRYVYPCHADYVPPQVMATLLARYRRMLAAPHGDERGSAFRGTLVSQFSFAKDVKEGYRDLRQELRTRKGEAA